MFTRKPFSLHTFVCAFSTALLVVCATATVSPEAQAMAMNTTVANSSDSVWRHTVGKQLARLLRSPQAHLRESALRNVIVLANRPNASYNLKAAIPALFDVLEESSNDAHRIMAVNALHTISNEHSSPEAQIIQEEFDRSTRDTIEQAVENHFQRDENKAVSHLRSTTPSCDQGD